MKINNILNLTIMFVVSLVSVKSLAAVKADMVINNAKVYTVDGQGTIAQAIAVKGNKIIYVGNNSGVNKHIGYYTQRINAKNRLVLPGLHDVHAHPLEASDSSFQCILKGAETLNQHIAKLKPCVNNTGNGWVLGWGHTLKTLLEANKDPISYLDNISTTKPIAIMESTSHSMWVNSAALAQLGFNANTANPSGGFIVKNSAGQPNGILLDTAGDMVMHKALGSPTAQDKNRQYKSLLKSLKLLKQNGITSVVNARLYWKRGYLDAWKKADNNWQLTARANMALWVYPEDVDDDAQISKLRSMYSNNANDFLKVNQIKMYNDGIPTNTTAAMLTPYLEDYGMNIGSTTGLNYFDEARMTYLISELETKGFDMLIHAIGDRGVNESLNAIEEASLINGNIGRTRRHRLTHVEFVNNSDINRFYSLNITADFQVAGDWTLPGAHEPLELALLGAARLTDHVPVKDIYNTGANVTLSSDWDVSSLSPFVGMMHSLQRDHQSLPNIKSAIESYTINAAYSMNQENKLGSIEVGKLADFAIVNQNILTVPTNTIGNTKVLMTILDGEVIYKNNAKW
jgi:predicted amidohydrolase YtcJ